MKDITEYVSHKADQLRKVDYKHLVSTQLEFRPYLHGIPYWTAAAVVGLIAVGYSGAFSACILAAQEIFANNPYWLFLTSPICFFFATWVVDRFAPMAGGTGIPQVVQALELDVHSQKAEVHRYLDLKVGGVVALSSLLCVLGAGSLGREGPMVHIAACLFYSTGYRFRRLFPHNEHRSWIVAGGAAGVAAAFNAPLAGVVFVLEELAQQHFHQFKTVVISAAIVGGMVSQWLSGKYLYFGSSEIGEVPFSSVPWAMLVGVLCGILAYPFQRLLKMDWRKSVPRYFRTRLRFSIAVGFCVAALAVFVNPMTIGGGVGVIEYLLRDGRADWSLLSGRFFGTIISHLSGCAGGFLAPSLALGATVGSQLATLTSYSNHNLLVLVGMSAFLSANLRAPFTAWVIVMEMTNRHQAIFPLMIASLVGHGTMHFLLDRKLAQKERAST